MKRSIFVLIAAVMLSAPAFAKLNVVATTADMASIAKEIGGDKIELTTLAKPTEDPHFVDAKPSFIVKLNHADVLVEGGAELEVGWLPTLLTQSRNLKLAAGATGHVLCAQGVRLLDVPTSLDRAKGDIHASGNPHFLVDPENAKIVARNIAEAFCAQDAPSTELYRSNLTRFIESLDLKLKEWQKTLEPFKGREVVSYHDSWLYFGQRFGLKMDLFLEPKPGIPPTPAHLAEVIAKMKADHIKVTIVDPYLNRKTAETVARNTEGVVVDVAQFPAGVKGTEGGYIPLIDYLVNSLAKALGEVK